MPTIGQIFTAQTSGNHIFIDESQPMQSISPKKPRSDGEKIYNVPLSEAFPSKFGRSSETGEIGIEIECEGTNLFQAPIKWWQAHQDSSLRAVADHPPIEYVLRKPIIRSDVVPALTYLSKKLKEAGSNLQMSQRTSVHIHVNCLPLTIKQIYQYICLYIIFEELLVDFSGPDRAGNLFCLRAKDAEHWIQVMESAIQQEDWNQLFNENLRYSSCNTASLGKFGSLEFRSMRGTVDQGLIQTWIDILLLLKDKALRFENPKEIVDSFQKLGPHDFLRDVFGGSPDLYNIFRNRMDLHKVLWDGMRLMRDVAYAIKWKPKLTEAQRLKKSVEHDQRKFPQYNGFNSSGTWWVSDMESAPPPTEPPPSPGDIHSDDLPPLSSHEGFYSAPSQMINTWAVIDHIICRPQPGVYIIQYSSGNVYVENYNTTIRTGIVIHVPNGQLLGCLPRTRYGINSNGQIISGPSLIGNSQYAPDQV